MFRNKWKWLHISQKKTNSMECSFWAGAQSSLRGGARGPPNQQHLPQILHEQETGLTWWFSFLLLTATGNEWNTTRVKGWWASSTYSCELFLPPLDSSLKLGMKKKLQSHKRKANRKTQPGHIYTLMHLLAFVKAKKIKKPGGHVTPSWPLGQPIATLLQPQASSRRADAEESPGHYTKVLPQCYVANVGPERG